MIPIQDFLTAVRSKTVLDRKLNEPQERSVRHPLQPALMLVAGPGSGKTTVLVLRALRHVLVDGFLPESVLITTFTRKAAAELRERLIDWGLSLVEHFKVRARETNNSALEEWLSLLDINSFQTGTLDSFLQRWLRATKPVGSPSPIMLEEFAAKFIFRRKVFRKISGPNASPQAAAQFEALKAHLSRYTFDGRAPNSQAATAELSFQLGGRLAQDLVDTEAFASHGDPDITDRPMPGAALVKLVDEYRNHLEEQLLVDFSTCAQLILRSLRDGTPYPNTSIPEIKAVLVDEYQDTNPIQEAIYFELVRRSKASFTVVGDDDQALYRFRGATVELFTSFVERCRTVVGGSDAETVYLVTNHRSSPQIIDFFNRFVAEDPAFQPARVKGKPLIGKNNPDDALPVLGLFRSTTDEIARGISDLLQQVFSSAGYRVPGSDVTVCADPARGALGDALFLASSVRELKDDDTQTPRLPKLLRDQLEAKGMGVFNPRGQDLRDIPNVGILLGLIAECVDTSNDAERSLYISPKSKDCVSNWRASARAFVESNPHPTEHGAGLGSFVAGWKGRKHSNSRSKWPEDTPVLDLIYKLIAWIPEFQNDPEHQVYLSAITRCVAQAVNYSAYGMSVLHTPGGSDKPATPHGERSVNSVFMDLLVPIAEREIDVDEDLLYAFPRSRLSVMTIHQAKGLEFPVVIVDIGSDFRTAHAKQAFRRFPREASAQAKMEDDLAPFTPIGGLRTQRSALDRTFDDLMRLYYVAYSRPQHLLLLVGTVGCIQYASKISNVAAMWRRDGSWSWRKDNPPQKKNTPVTPEHHGLHLI
jgi:DNA helicase-2/ATP-dependent DNA helicase PcrA